MKKLGIILLTGLFTLTLFAACGKKDEENTKTSYIIGLDDTFAPMGFKDESGAYIGFDIELAQAVAQELDINFEFKSIDWSSATLELSTKKIDLIWNGMTITDKRKEAMAISQPYFTGDQTIYVTDTSPLTTKADLADKVIGIQLGSSAEIAFASDPISSNIKELKKYQDNTQAMLDLKASRVDAVVLDSIAGDYYIVKQPGYKRIHESFAEEEMGIGARKDDAQLIADIDSAIAVLKANGIYDEIYQKWFGGTQ